MTSTSRRRADFHSTTGVWQRFATNWAIAALNPVTTAFREGRLQSRRDVPGVIRSQSVAFAVGRQSRTHFAFGASIASGTESQNSRKKQALLAVPDGRTDSLRGESSSHYQQEGELVFPIVVGRGRRSMAHFGQNRCHTPHAPGGRSFDLGSMSSTCVTTFRTRRPACGPTDMGCRRLGRPARAACSLPLAAAELIPSVAACTTAPPAIRSGGTPGAA